MTTRNFFPQHAIIDPTRPAGSGNKPFPGFPRPGEPIRFSPPIPPSTVPINKVGLPDNLAEQFRIKSIIGGKKAVLGPQPNFPAFTTSTLSGTEGPNSNFFRNLLDEVDPNIAFQSFSNQFGKGKGRQDFFRNSFSQIQNQHLGELGRIARQGQIPQQSFTDFLEDFDFKRFAFGVSPLTRGEGIGRFKPQTRFLR